MVRNVFYYSKTAKINSNFTKLVLICCPLVALGGEFIGALRFKNIIFIIVIFRSILGINFRIGEKKTEIFNFIFVNLTNNNDGGSVNQSII